MSIFKQKYAPEDVFVPRGEYNRDMYIDRPVYEDGMNIALKSRMCILIHGQSGTGKTWLTRRVLEANNIYYKTINLAHASNSGSIYICFKNTMGRENWEIRTRYSERKAATINAQIASGELETTKDYELGIDYFMEFLKFINHRAPQKNKQKYIVFENLETILNDDVLMKELTNLITLVDDDEVVKYKTKFIIIGATKTVHQFFNSTININTIGNRLYELPELGTLTVTQARLLIKRGFDKLEIPFKSEEQLNNCMEEILNVTAGIPQRIHELCLEFASLCRKYDKVIQNEWIGQAERTWIRTSLNKNYSYISRIIKNYRRDDIKYSLLYCIAQMDILYFSSEDIDEVFEKEFPSLIANGITSSSSFLDELCLIKYALLEKASGDYDDYNEYYFSDFKCALCLRAILHKEDEKVIKYDIYEI